MAKKNLKGKFITFEGSEGSGKSTQAQLLYNYLKKKGFSVINIREPGSTALSEKVRKILLDPRNGNITAMSEMLLYMAARSQLVDDVILPALKKGKIIICDRFLDATLAYQGFGCKVDIGLIKDIGSYVTRGIKPDITFFLDIDIKEGLRRTGRDKDRIEQRPISYHKKVRSGYLKLAKEEPGRVKIIPANHDKLKVQSVIRGYVNNLI